MATKEKKILLYERYDGVRFILEHSLAVYVDKFNIYSSHLKNEIKSRIETEKVDLLLTEISKFNPDGLEISYFARKLLPELQIIWITVQGCHDFLYPKEELGKVTCIEKPLDIRTIREIVLQKFEVPN